MLDFGYIETFKFLGDFKKGSVVFLATQGLEHPYAHGVATVVPGFLE
jgi:hypothetical protein